MEFWGVEVKPGKALKVPVTDEKVIHLSQASLGEFKKDKSNDFVPLYVNINGQKLVLGHLSPENFPSQSFDLVFEKDFELSHNSKNGSVYFTGYTSEIPDESEPFYDSEDSGSEDEPLLVPAPAENGKPEPKAVTAIKATASKPQPKKDSKAMEVDEDSDEVDSDDSDDEGDEDGVEGSEDESDEDEETPIKVEVSKKRAAESEAKTPISSKKAKAATPQKTDRKKSGHTATPHPAKKADKTPATPKSGGQFSCSPCKKTFGSDTGLQSHNKAKHVSK
jgi:nucleophosmin 1